MKGISLTLSGKQKLGNVPVVYGLNKRGPSGGSGGGNGSGGGGSVKPSVFSDTDGAEEGTVVSERERVNALIRRQQAETEKMVVVWGITHAEGSSLGNTVKQAAASSLPQDVMAYDDWAAANVPSKTAPKKTLEQPAKYVGLMKQKALEREQVNSRIYERKLAKERDADEAEFGHLERFVTQGYKEKLAADRAAEAEQAKRDAQSRDVSGEGGMMGFYKGLFDSVAFGGNAAPVHAGTTVDDTSAERGEKRPRSPEVVDEEKVVDDKIAEKVETEAPKVSAPQPVVPPAQEATQVVPSREDAIAAAKARYLSRKAAQPPV